MIDSWRGGIILGVLSLAVTALVIQAATTLRSGPAQAQAEFVCTQIIGYSTTSTWFPAAEAMLDNAKWQLLYANGGAVDRWSNPAYPGWSDAPISPCTQDRGAPDRIVLDVAVGAYATNIGLIEHETRQAIATIRRKYPSVRQIVLQPEHGGPDHTRCPWSDAPFGAVRATYNHPSLESAIERVVGGDVVRGADPLVSACSDFSDAIGHVTSAGARALGESNGRFYAGGSPARATVAPTMPTEPAPSVPAATVVFADGGLRGSLQLDGIDAWAEAPDEAEINGVGDWSLEAWFKDDHPDGYAHDRARIITKGDTARADVPFFVDVWMGQLWAGRRVDGASQAISFDLVGNGIPAGEWRHVAVTFDSARFRLTLSLDGAEVAQGSVGGYSLGTSLPLSIGRNGGEEANFWTGAVDEIRLWNTVRTAADIQANLNRELTGAQAGLVGYWRFNEVDGGIARDGAGRPQDATLKGSAVWSQDSPMPPAAALRSHEAE